MTLTIQCTDLWSQFSAWNHLYGFYVYPVVLLAWLTFKKPSQTQDDKIISVSPSPVLPQPSVVEPDLFGLAKQYDWTQAETDRLVDGYNELKKQLNLVQNKNKQININPNTKIIWLQ